MRFGIFLAPFHAALTNPTLALERDLDLIQHLDKLGFDEAWIGEHHSAGVEVIASPEVFIAAAAERTRHIKLGTGVTSLPFHHPLILADRTVLLDHLTRGRFMLGCGPGSLPSDAVMMGIEPVTQRPRMEESLNAITRLLAGETVTMKTDWFTLQDARLHILPYSKPCFEIATAAMISPSGPRAAGRFGTSLLSISASSQGGFNALASAWEICEEKAAEYGRSVNRENWRLVAPMHLAETEEKAREQVLYGIHGWVEYFSKVAALPLAPATDDPNDLVDTIVGSGLAVVGTPDQAIEQIERLKKQSGGFGSFLIMAHDWARPEETHKSYELFSQEVMPHFQGSTSSLRRSWDYVTGNRAANMEKAGKAVMNAISMHAQEQAEKNAK